MALYAIIAGVGPGTGATIARKFAKAYPVVLLARNEDSFKPIVAEIERDGGRAFGVAADVSSRESLNAALSTAEKSLGSLDRCAAAIFNASARPSPKSFLELSEQEFLSPFTVSAQGGFHFTQAVLPKLLNSVGTDVKYPPTLLFTGATASIKGSARFAPFAVAKSAGRIMAQSLAREYGPQGVHVAHMVIDGIIDLPLTREYMPDAKPDALISPNTIADTYWYVHTQPASGFTHELEIRPSAEKW
ncbi:uncharacterized protein HMPREF1541_04315 [Cyphellophora europaea CBS 101466]|uniref:7-alpha-hydroxysteroid dehydrogenase n=1 Tax=Cyphellophora europaea (strain CBS 101466) TaxID=1220924 RepID=W2RUQ9_CYPE1|nr:uncharacterized protein HMPREF1541_04315 [Cyphellophora europaea CBS 101466]ETN40040.1 hypothetical protein HMPREF1541_04315 [Cyphellophora europaea CBS 101466]